MSFDEELLIEKVVERPWEATIAQAIRVMEGADIEALGLEALFLKPWELKIEQATDAMLRAGYDKLGLECMAGSNKVKVVLTLTEVGEE